MKSHNRPCSSGEKRQSFQTQYLFPTPQKGKGNRDGIQCSSAAHPLCKVMLGDNHLSRALQTFLERLRSQASPNPVNHSTSSLLETHSLEGKVMRKFTHSIILRHLLESHARKLQEQKDAGKHIFNLLIKTLTRFSKRSAAPSTNMCSNTPPASCPQSPAGWNSSF